jgi:hypothetical protein
MSNTSSSTPGTSGNSGRKPEQPRIEIINDAAAEILSHSTPRGFGTFRGDQRYQEIFEDTAEGAPDFGYPGTGLGASYQRPFSHTNFGSDAPYRDTVIVLHHNKQGIRLFLQANLRTFLVILLIIAALVSSPSLADMINTLLRAVLGAR